MVRSCICLFRWRLVFPLSHSPNVYVHGASCYGMLWLHIGYMISKYFQRGTNHQLSTLLSLCICTCHAKSQVLAWTTPSSTTKSPIVGGILAPRKEKKIDVSNVEVSACTHKTSSNLLRLGECAWQVLAELERLGDVCDHWFTLDLKLFPLAVHCKVLSSWTPEGKDTGLLNRIAERRGPRNAPTEQAMRADLTSDETSSCVCDCWSCFTSKSEFHTRLNRWSYDIFRHTEAHTSNFLVEAWWQPLAYQWAALIFSPGKFSYRCCSCWNEPRAAPDIKTKRRTRCLQTCVCV